MAECSIHNRGMRVCRSVFASSVVPALAILLACAGCYKPKADIDAIRPQAEKYLADMEHLGKAIAALPPLTQDTLSFRNPPELRFLDGPDGTQNAQLIHLEELSDIGGSHIYDRLVSGDYFQPAVSLLKSGTDPYIHKVTKDLIDWRFHQLLDVKYLVVLRTSIHKSATVTGPKEFEAGEIRGEAYLCEMADPAASHGGISYVARNSQEVSVRFRSKDQDQQNIDRSLAVREDMEKQAVKMIQDKLKNRLPGAKFPSYW
jgi:hypothetical protein